MGKIIVICIAASIFLLIDTYIFFAVRTLTESLSSKTSRIIHIAYWAVTALCLIAFFSYHFVDQETLGRLGRTFIMTGLFMVYFSKLFMVLFLFLDDIVRGVQWVLQQFGSGKASSNPEVLDGTEKTGISRSEFLVKAGVVAATVPFVGMSYGIIYGAHDYRIRRKTVYLPNLPKAFDGIRLAQLSDIHSGSFFNKTAVKGGVEMLLREKPDLVFFTGDLVNNKADEVKGYIDIFEKVKAPLGVYSTLGNHDYGDYVQWPSKEAKRNNLERLKEAHAFMGWKLMMNEHKIIIESGEPLAILGIENYGAKGRFPKYGDLSKAYSGTEDLPVKLLLSHDPSHWDAQVRTEFPDIDLMFAGHTHGMQFGVEIPGFKWSPVQYMYDQWAGLYTKGNQHLYVNRGYGYLGFPGRIGMPPEITLMELKSGTA